jgi:SAM-dependent methyltransferase
MEIDPDAAGIARARGLPVLTGSIEAAASRSELGGETFDVVMLMDVLEHLVDPAATLRALHAHLAPGGRVLITGPNVAYWGVRRDLLFGRFDYVDAGILDRTHLHFFTARTWRELVTSAGYRVNALVPAEVMLPLEGRLRRLGAPESLLGRAGHLAARLAPTLFAVVYLIEASPAV